MRSRVFEAEGRKLAKAEARHHIRRGHVTSSRETALRESLDQLDEGDLDGVCGGPVVGAGARAMESSSRYLPPVITPTPVTPRVTRIF